MAGLAEVLVVGAGPAGIAAAVRAAEGGARVLVMDDNPAAGGQIWRAHEPASDDSQAAYWFRRFQAAPIPFVTGAQIISADLPSRSLLVETAEETHWLRFEKLILATGARELFLPFPGWTLPGVMGVGGLQALVKSGLSVAGENVVLAGSGPLLLAVAAHLRKKGALIRVVAEQAHREAVYKFARKLARYPGKLRQAVALKLALARIPYSFGCWVEAAMGGSRLEAVQLRQGSRTWREACGFAGIAYGLCPNVELATLLGCAIENGCVLVNDRQQSSIDTIFCAGEATGIGGLDLAIVEGEIAGYAATECNDKLRALAGRRRRATAFACALNRAFALRPELRSLAVADTIVCRCEDVRFDDVKNFPSLRAAKLHTRCGMGPCQGRICGPATEFFFRWERDSIRPPVFPARIGSLTTGREFETIGNESLR